MKNLKEIKSKLEKLNFYLDYLTKTNAEISNLDKDTFLAQIRELYDIALFGPTEIREEKVNEIKVQVENEQVIDKTEQPKTILENRVETPAPKVEQPQEEKKIIENTIIPEEKKEEPKPLVTEKAEQEQKEIIIQKEEIIIPEIKATTVIEPKETETEKTEITAEPIKIEIKEKKAEPEEFSFNEEFEDLFVFKMATDLASKLSEKPIPNLSKALAVNEKLNYVQQLFAGETAKFGEAYNFFNEAGSFDKARKYMEMHLISKYNWLSREKKNTAKEFIKLIRRRYL